MIYVCVTLGGFEEAGFNSRVALGEYNSVGHSNV